MSKKIAIVTGASQGIGRAVAIDLAKQGYQVALLARSEQKLKAVAEYIVEENHLKNSNLPLIYPVDVSNRTAIEYALNDLLKQQGRIDVLFNNAGIVRRGNSDISVEAFLEQVNINFLGAYYCLNKVIPIMKQQQSGYIFNLISRAARMAVPDRFGYGVSKYGLRGMSEYLFKELAAYGISVTGLYPGLVHTEMTSQASIPSEEMIAVDDIVKTVSYLLGLSKNACVEEVYIQCRRFVDAIQQNLDNK